MAVRPMTLGWHPIDPGPAPRSVLLDAPPSSASPDPTAAYLQWRSAVEADETRLEVQQRSGPLWAPVPLSGSVHVIPTFGGTPAAIENVVTTLLTSGLECGISMCRVVNLSGWNLSTSLRDQMRSARRNKALFEVVGSRGSTVNLFGNPDPSELIALLIDALRLSAERSAGRQSQQERQELERIIRMLSGQVSLDRIIDAVDVALGASGTSSALSVDETRDLQDYFATVVAQRRATQDRLSDLHVDLQVLQGFGKAPGRSADALGNGRTSVRWYDVASGSSTAEVELGRELLSRAVLQTYAKPTGGELLVVIGAERLAEEVRDEMVNASQRNRKRLALFYTQINDAAKRMLGHAGSTLALFLGMPNADDANVAAEFIGREYKFVINGISIAEGKTEDWSRTSGTSSSSSTSRGTSTTRNHGHSGGAFNFSRSVGTSVSKSFEQGTSTSTTAGGSTSTTTTSSAGRVHEFVVEPEAFQRMPEDTMMIVGQGTVSIVSSDNGLRRSKQTSKQPLVVP